VRTYSKVLVVKMDWRGLILVVVLGICIGLVSGFVENSPEASVIGHKYYGYPLVWRITRMFLGEEYLYLGLFINCLIWITIVSVITMFALWSSRWMSRKND
jgi:hypothetical protein